MASDFTNKPNVTDDNLFSIDSVESLRAAIDSGLQPNLCHLVHFLSQGLLDCADFLVLETRAANLPDPLDRLALLLAICNASRYETLPPSLSGLVVSVLE